MFAFCLADALILFYSFKGCTLGAAQTYRWHLPGKSQRASEPVHCIQKSSQIRLCVHFLQTHNQRAHSSLECALNVSVAGAREEGGGEGTLYILQEFDSQLRNRRLVHPPLAPFLQDSSN